MKRAQQSKSKLKSMLIVFFAIKGINLEEWVPEDSTLLQTASRKTEKKKPEERNQNCEKMFSFFKALHQLTSSSL